MQQMQLRSGAFALDRWEQVTAPEMRGSMQQVAFARVVKVVASRCGGERLLWRRMRRQREASMRIISGGAEARRGMAGGAPMESSESVLRTSPSHHARRPHQL